MKKKNYQSARIMVFLAILMTLGLSLTCYADNGSESAEGAGPDVALRREAPVYTGPFQEGDLEELTVHDFEAFGTEPELPQDQYRQYRKLLRQPASGILVPYRLRIVDQDLALNDFLGFDVPEELAEARYDGYLSMIPATVDGRSIHYVYVYHKPLSRKEVESEAPEI